MPFQIPQYIEQEFKVLGPLTFKQVLFIGAGLLGGAVLYFILASKSFILFLFLAFLVVSGGLALALIEIEGRALPTLVTNFFSHFFSSKTYLWQKKAFSPKIVEMAKPEKKVKEKPSLKITEKSQIDDLATKLETGIR